MARACCPIWPAARRRLDRSGLLFGAGHGPARPAAAPAHRRPRCGAGRCQPDLVLHRRAGPGLAVRAALEGQNLVLHPVVARTPQFVGHRGSAQLEQAPALVSAWHGFQLQAQAAAAAEAGARQGPAGRLRGGRSGAGQQVAAVGRTSTGTPCAIECAGSARQPARAAHLLADVTQLIARLPLAADAMHADPCLDPARARARHPAGHRWHVFGTCKQGKRGTSREL